MNNKSKMNKRKSVYKAILSEISTALYLLSSITVGLRNFIQVLWFTFLDYAPCKLCTVYLSILCSEVAI